MSTEYEDGHPLYGQTAEWIANRAEHTSRFDPGRTGSNMSLYSISFAALAHEYKRLKKVSESKGCINARRTYEELHRLKREVFDLAEEAGVGDPDGAVPITALTFELRRLIQQNNDLSDRLKRGADWREVLQKCSEPLGMKRGDSMSEAPGFARKLRERAETAERSLESLRSEQGQPEEQASLFATELRNVVRLLDERPARGVLFGPAPEDGVAHIVNKRLERDAARISELENSHRTLRIKHDTVAVQLDQALGHRDENGMVIKAEPKPTLERIAADVARIAANLERQSDPTPAPYIHTQSDGRFDRD